MFGKTSLHQSCRFRDYFSRSGLDFFAECLSSLDGGKVLALQLVAGKILPVLGYSVASSTQGDLDSGEYSGRTHHISNKNCLFEEVAFCSVVGNFLAPGSDSGWSCLHPKIVVGVFGCFPIVQDSLWACFFLLSSPC